MTFMPWLPSRRFDWRTYAELAASLTATEQQRDRAIGKGRAQRDALAALIETEAAKLDEDAACIMRLGLDDCDDAAIALRAAAVKVRLVAQRVDDWRVSDRPRPNREPTEAERCAAEGHPQLDCSTSAAGGSICRCGAEHHEWRLS